MLRTLLVPLDGSALAERALPIAFDIARRAGGEVHLARAHVPLAVVGASGEGIMTQDLLTADDAMRDRAKQYVEATATRLSAEWGVRAVAHVDDGGAAGYITQVADDVLADLVVMTTHGAGGFAPGWLGSVADAVIRHSYRPVLALPENDEQTGGTFTPRRIMVTLDGSPNAAAIVPAAQDLAVVFGADVEFVRIVAPFVPNDVLSAMSSPSPDAYGIDAEAAYAKQQLGDMVAAIGKHGVKATATVRVEMSPTRALLDHVKENDPDCVAVATQGRGISRLFLGSVADKLIRGAGRPVLVLRPPSED